MKEIIYNSETKEIQFSGKITSFVFYSQFFDALDLHYKDNGNDEIPSFSFICVENFDASVLPNLIGIGIIIKKIHGKECKIPLRFARVSSTKFLDNAGFFDNVGEENIYYEALNVDGLRKEITNKRGLSLFDFNTKELGFYNNQNIQKKYNNEHKVRMYEDESYEYYINFSDPDIKREELDELLNAIRTNKYNNLKPFVEKHFFNILYREERPIEQVKIILMVLTEIICNSILYSGSLCAAILQSKNNKTTISVSDFGVGFEYSFKLKPNFDYIVTNSFSKVEQIKFKNYLLIFDALYYSKNKKRENLFTLLELVINIGGKMRIHYDDVQVIFTSNRCQRCSEIEPVICAKCLLDNRSNDKLISPVRFFSSKFQGIHIEIELNF